MAGGDGSKHGRQQTLVVLQVSVDDGVEPAARHRHSFHARARQATPADPAQAADTFIATPNLLDEISGAVGRVIVDNQDFPADVRQTCLDAANQFGDVARLVEGRDDDRKFKVRSWRCPLRRR